MLLPVIPLSHESKVNLTFFTDVHIAAKPIGRRRGSYTQEILDKLIQIADMTSRIHGVGICGGDLYHVKGPRSDSNTHGLNTLLTSVFQRFPTGAVYGVIGNHDLTGDSLATVPDQPIGALIQSGAYHGLGAGLTEGQLDEGTHSVIFEAQNGLQVQVDGFDYLNGQDLLEQIRTRTKTVGVEHRVAVVHGFNQEGASGVMFNSDFALGWNDLDGLGYDAFVWGHDHIRKGVRQSPGGVYHVQLGSLARAALTKDEVDRSVNLAILSFSEDGLLVAERPLVVRPLELAFHTADLAVERVDNRKDVSTFLAGLDKQVAAISTEDPTEALKTLTEDPEVIRTILEVCEIG